MSGEKDGPKDLFGDPWSPPRDARGRKRHKRNAQVAEKISVLRGAGMTVEDIVARIGLSEPTLRKYYFRELDGGATLARAVLIESLWDKAKAGSASAARIIREEFEKGQAAVPVSRRKSAAQEPRAEKLGKKELADRAAQSAHEGTSWGNILN